MYDRCRYSRRRATPRPARASPARAIAAVLAMVVGGGGVLAGPVEFSRDVRPILSDRCFKCHGPDERARKSDLRLDRRDGALRVLAPGQLERSELARRIRSDDPDERMPPPSSKLSLSPGEIDTLLRWIEAGAPYELHWSFAPIRRVPVPAVERADWPRNEIDHFILARLEKAGIEPSPEASRERLIRRVTFDLIGLPPTLEEIDAFLADREPDAYERLVARLLERTEYGERMAADWLDVARYSDTYGYQVDRDRFVWPWRDWVIRAFNENLPWDQFVTRQLAGDLLPDAGDDAVLATTFNRLHPQKVEGGSVPEEFRVEYVADRLHTFATAFLGLTLECARCHDHKYDPISQREYYELFAFFNNIDEAGLYSYFTSSVPTPTLVLADPAARERIAEVERRIAEAERNVLTTADARVAAFEAWLDERPSEATVPGRIAHLDFESIGDGPNRGVPGRVGQAVELSGDDGIGLEVGNFRRFEPFSVALWMKTPDFKERAVVFHRSRAWTDAGSRGYQLLIEDGRLSASLIHFWPGNAIRVRTREPVPVGEWLHVAVTWDGSSRADGLRIFVNGSQAACDVVRDHLTKNITGGGGDTIRIGERFRDRGFTRGLVDEFQVFDRELTALEVAHLHDGESLTTALRSPAAALGGARREALLAYYLSTVDAEYARALAGLRAAREERSKAVDGLREIMVMRELPERRPTFRLHRGAYDAPREPVESATPDVLSAFGDRPRNRLGLAQWLTDPEHPLTARVAVNRLWQLCFGRGLVDTPEDFGSQGRPPTHPELLDWLARDFVDSGWDIKRMLARIVGSATYRQVSTASPELRARDPENRLLARAPSYRLAAEMIRDGALAASGLLVRRIGGPSVRPYELAVSFKPIKPESGEGLYRRSVYTFWKRTAPAPAMMTLDASKRDVCVVRRERTSSPLQAFVLLNGTQYVEAARVLGERLLRKHGEDVDALVVELFRVLVSRRPDAREMGVLRALFEEQLEYFSRHTDRALEYLKTGQAPFDPSIPPQRLAAAGVLAGAVMGYDESLVKR